jgi:hypothetical protein
MAWRIDENAARGEIDNRTRGTVQGKIWLAGREEPLVLNLNGNGHKDLAGCKLTFSNPSPQVDPTLNLSPLQTGTAGDMTAARKVRIRKDFDYPASKPGKRPPEEIANALYLEWFSDTSGRVVIESTNYQVSVSEPAWHLSPEEETQQKEANAEAMRSFAESVGGPPDPREEAAYEGDPQDEFEWELFLRASDRRTDKLGELMEKYQDDPNCDRLIAREMGWTHIEEMLDAAESSEEEGDAESDMEEADYDEVDFDQLEGSLTEEYERPRHPLVEHLIERSAELHQLAENQKDEDLREMVSEFSLIGPKVAGALIIAHPRLHPDLHMNGLVVAKLKRALGELTIALSAANRVKQKNGGFPVDHWIAEILETRQAILSLMDKFRRENE